MSEDIRWSLQDSQKDVELPSWEKYKEMLCLRQAEMWKLCNGNSMQSFTTAVKKCWLDCTAVSVHINFGLQGNEYSWYSYGWETTQVWLTPWIIQQSCDKRGVSVGLMWKGIMRIRIQWISHGSKRNPIWTPCKSMGIVCRHLQLKCTSAW